MANKKRLSDKLHNDSTVSLAGIIEQQDLETGEIKESAVLQLAPAHSGINQAMYYLDVSYLERYNEHEMQRLLQYSDYDDMEENIPEIKTALDIYADVACMGDKGDEKAFEIVTKNEKIKKILDAMVKRLELNDKVWAIARELRKYGDNFEEPVIKGRKIIDLKNLTVYSMYRKENKKGKLLRYEQRDFKGKKIADLDIDQVIHLRNDRMRNAVPHSADRHKYGRSLLAPLRRLYVMLLNMEDGMVIGRLYRSQNRYKVTVDVTGLGAKQAMKKIKAYKKLFRRKRLTDVASGRVIPNKFRQLLDPHEDFFIGARKDGVTPDVDTIQGQTGLSDIGDVQHFQNKMFATLKVPKAFMAFEHDVNAKATLATQDKSFGRSVKSLQTRLAGFVKLVGNIELELNGIDPEKEENFFEAQFAKVSMEDEEQKSSVFATNIDSAVAGIDAGLFSPKYGAIKIVGISEEEYEADREERDAHQKKKDNKALTIAQGLKGKEKEDEEGNTDVTKGTLKKPMIKKKKVVKKKTSFKKSSRGTGQKPEDED